MGRTVGKRSQVSSGNNGSPPPYYQRIVVKAGTSVLTTEGEHLDLEAMTPLVGQLAEIHKQGAQLILVTSGAIAAGRHVIGDTRASKDIPFRQVLAALGQSHLMRTYQQLFQAHDIRVAQALLTRNDLSDRQGYLNVRNTLLALLELGVVPIVNENDVVAVEEIGEVFGDNDTLSALVANLVDADLLSILTDTEGLYTADPQLHPDAQLVRRVERVDSSVAALASKHHNPWGRGGMTTKLEAARLASASGVTTVICNGRKQNVVVRLARGEEIGTLFMPSATAVESRKRWLLSGLAIRGDILVDEGAVKALTSRNGSLLPAGILELRGEFQRGDAVYILAPGERQVACGISNYSSQDVARIKGCRSDRIHTILGYQYGQEVVHRNNMVLL